ncbi:hypothetical protein SAMN05443661_105120 [Natronobacterium gregoryi]|uniref:Uncharacterized protein n=2 Tax=Natronobacterium gregoryi TaxID=44930 RepID=L0AF27_NATGS|nr:hypothetical protein [Natronobacterium gregoryi]AFZ72446.1 hypothetical protein Natgr_1222 [Natronobacterium gregoryi SP2]SFI78370.1 hypothetical protein SAMN05443661_105120 [Natronobacterium gregoryi]
MLDTNHSSRLSFDVAITERVRERLSTLGKRLFDRLDGGFMGVIRSHVRGEVYGGC